MKKEIYRKALSIFYYGQIDELKKISKNIILVQWGKRTWEMLEEDINNLEKITETYNHYSSHQERIYFSKNYVQYRPNSSKIEVFKNTIKPNSIKADKMFLEKNSQYKIDIFEK